MLINTAIAAVLDVADCHMPIATLHPTVVMALISIPNTSDTLGWLRALGVRAIQSLIARDVISTSCPFRVIRDFHMMTSVSRLLHNPRTVKKHVRPKNVYVSPDAALLSRVYGEYISLRVNRNVVFLLLFIISSVCVVSIMFVVRHGTN